MPWFIVSYDITPDNEASNFALNSAALQWGWDRYTKFDRDFEELPQRTLIGEFESFEAAYSNFMDVCRRLRADSEVGLEKLILIEVARSVLTSGREILNGR